MYYFFHQNEFPKQSYNVRKSYIKQQKVYGGWSFFVALATLIFAASFPPSIPYLLPVFATIFSGVGLFFSLFIDKLEVVHNQKTREEMRAIFNDVGIQNGSIGGKSYTAIKMSPLLSSKPKEHDKPEPTIIKNIKEVELAEGEVEVEVARSKNPFAP